MINSRPGRLAAATIRVVVYLPLHYPSFGKWPETSAANLDVGDDGAVVGLVDGQVCEEQLPVGVADARLLFSGPTFGSSVFCDFVGDFDMAVDPAEVVDLAPL